MKITSLRRPAALGAAVVLGLGLTACSAANEGPGGTDAGAAPSGESLSGTLNGGGASSQEAAQGAWRAGFQEANPDVTVNYDPIGSGGGREQFISGGFPFAGSDSYLNDDEGELSGATERCEGEAPIEVPNYVSPIAVIYNLEGVDDLQLSPSTLGGIFAGDITTWDDEAIAGDNPSADLPAETINPVHRSDESGTTGNFTNYLATVAEDTWTFGEVEEWPVEGGEGASGTSGVVAAVTNGANSIGYADASQAGDLGKAAVGVGDGFELPTPEAAAKILEVSPKAETDSDSQLVFDLDYTTEEAGVYPIVLSSYLIACPSYADAAEGELVKAYLSYIISDDGQSTSAENAGSAPLPDTIAGEAQAIVDGITVG
ncbi:MAG: phosphate ABC transporter substrate-binding protein PstS [Nocardioides sp.]